MYITYIFQKFLKLSFFLAIKFPLMINFIPGPLAGPEHGTSGLEKTVPPGELEFSSRTNYKNIKNLFTFF